MENTAQKLESIFAEEELIELVDIEENSMDYGESLKELIKENIKFLINREVHVTPEGLSISIDEEDDACIMGTYTATFEDDSEVIGRYFAHGFHGEEDTEGFFMNAIDIGGNDLAYFG